MESDFALMAKKRFKVIKRVFTFFLIFFLCGFAKKKYIYFIVLKSDWIQLEVGLDITISRWKECFIPCHKILAKIGPGTGLGSRPNPS